MSVYMRAIYALNPLESASTRQTLMIPMLPATDVKIVRPFFVSKFLALSASDVKKLIRARGLFFVRF